MNHKLVDSLITIIGSLSEEERKNFEEKLFFDNNQIRTQELINLAQKGNSFDFLADEPDIYTLEDGESV
ncbi:hypothetical protein WH8501_06905 [Crocosphaera watsonii WH 8501]|uniref:Uncharacterized protein n=2 Tax=Crocosphaera watsonii TaxID=263511 RepID=G5J1L5_CROWT|nr:MULTISPECIES: hypothetical protein [Crocosphaera]EHJ13923.1 hypothetical protein CWATWH0003_1397 [Crocosphaera watsonii WH 0003]NQZ61279.1 hypothetical protein [Crocosphaera sp.]CCQ49162.1 hypothetical protein CWATWH8502_2664 [Crocosphaera watsonii WH 8502]